MIGRVQFLTGLLGVGKIGVDGMGVIVSLLPLLPLHHDSDALDVAECSVSVVVSILAFLEGGTLCLL